MIPTNNRELSWLAFNDRVLQEACDPAVPLMQRLRFLGIFSSNQDEFIKVRLAGLIRRAKSRLKCSRRLSGGYLPADLLELVSAKIDKNQKIFAHIYRGVISEMEECGIRVINETELSEEQRRFCLDYFASVVSIRLVPLIINKAKAFPDLLDDQIYHGVKMQRGGRTSYAIIRIPVSSDSPRFVELPSPEGRHDLIMVDDIIRLCLNDVFFMFSYDHISAYTFKIMRDAELVLDDDISTSLMEKMEDGLDNRLKGRPVRMVYDEQMPEDLLRLLLGKLKMNTGQLVGSTRYHMMRDLMNFPKVRPDLEEPKSPPLRHPDIAPFTSLLKVVRQKDILLNYPYHTFNHLVDFLREAAIDPKVTSIYITLYRTAERSKVISTLANAARNGKNVVALVELMARFDEEQNIRSVERLQQAGVKVLDGLRDLKVHGKIVLVERREGSGTRGYVYIGTGNFNESTARLYSDLGLFTSHPGLADDARAVFDFLLNTHKHFSCKHLLAAPYFMRPQIEQLINREIRNARAGKPAYIHAKCNTLTDERMVRLLYKAGQAGVDIRLIIRGACCLMPRVKKQSENIGAVSIVDKYLEHTRLFLFCNGGQEKAFISSADWMTRNLDKRLEIAAPILSESVRRALRDFFDIQWADNVKARDLTDMGVNTYVSPEGAPPLRAQTAVYDYYLKALEKGNANAG
ncbi:MAG: polyphosphate kinase 1 [Candidatus Adiutrix sp.]|jgi:polyphosphate kinase|nr:polyphosphate kinase 1 [Candidatus Adiutrix sp.]